MNDTLLRKKNQVTLPAEIVEAAGLTTKDRIDWRFEAGEIRGRKRTRRQIVKAISPPTSLAPLSDKVLAASFAKMSAEEIEQDAQLGRASLKAQKARAGK